MNMTNTVPPEIDQLCSLLTAKRLTPGAFIESCLQLMSVSVDCPRAGLWRFAGDKPCRVLRCLRLYDRPSNTFTKVPNQSEERASEYFAAFERDGHIIANDVYSHPATCHLFDQFLRHTGARSLLAAAFSFNGRLFGAFTCTRMTEHTEWSYRQLLIVSRIGSTATLALARHSPGQFSEQVEMLDHFDPEVRAS